MAQSKFSGLQIAGEDDKIHLFDINGIGAEVRQTYKRTAADRSELELAFKLAAPHRFDVGVLVPAGCRNACAVLNGQLLISWFGDDAPVELPGIEISSCQQKGGLTSTLRPGRIQKLNFRWQDGDLLRFYWIW